MGTLYLLSDPFSASRLIAGCTGEIADYDSVLAVPAAPAVYRNPQEYGQPSTAGFFMRGFSFQTNTAGFGNFEFWPTREALELMLKDSGFSRTQELSHDDDPYKYYSFGQSVMLFSHK
jgi:hypothetical protein